MAENKDESIFIINSEAINLYQEALHTVFNTHQLVPVNFFKVSIIGYPGQERFFNFSKIPYLCAKAEIPGISFATTNRRIYGPLEKVPILTSYTDITLDFLCVGDKMFPRNMFEDWIEYINPKDTWNFKYKDNYTARSIEISQFVKTSQSVQKIKLINAFPISIRGSHLNFSDSYFQTVSVTFAFKTIETEFYDSTLKISKELKEQLFNETKLQHPNENFKGNVGEFTITI